MKKYSLILATAFTLFAFGAQAQSCCSKSKKKASCAMSTAQADNSSASKDSETMNAAMTLDLEGQTTETFMVYGNCGMCERTIEGSLAKMKAVSSADWDKETDMMTVTFDPEKVTLDEIKQRIADVGYDTETHRAKDKVYANLPGCCQYDRPEQK